MLDQGAARTWPHPAWPEVGFAGRDDAYHAAAQCVDNHKHLPFDHAHQPKSFFAVIMPCIGLRDAIWMAESRLHSYPLLADNNLVYAYAKNVSANLTPDQLRRLAEVMQAEVRDE